MGTFAVFLRQRIQLQSKSTQRTEVDVPFLNDTHRGECYK